MKSKALKTAVLAIEVVALTIAIAAAALVFLYWRMGQGPVSLGLFRSSAETAIERRLPAGYDARITSIHLQRASGGGDLRLDLAGLKILDTDETAAAEAPDVTAVFSLRDLIHGEVGPKTLFAGHARFRIVRGENLNVEIPIAKEGQKKQSLPIVSSFIDGNLIKSAFESAQINSAEITFFDAASGRSWSAPDTQIYLRRQETGLVARIRGGIDMNGVKAGLDANAAYREEDGVIDVVLEGENFPVGDLLSTFYGDRAAIIDAPVSGEAAISFTAEGDVKASKFDAMLGPGALTLGGVRREVASIAWVTAFDPEENRFSIDRLAFDMDGARGEVAGEVSISFGDDIRKPERIRFDLNSDEVVIAAPGRFERPLAFADNRLEGRYIVSDRRFEATTLETSVEGLVASGSLSFEMPRAERGQPAPSPGVKADLSFEGALDPEKLLNLWPKDSIGDGARDWVEERLASAHIDNLKFMMNLAPGAIGEDGGLPDDAMELTFDARDVVAYYVKEMTPLRNGAGSGVVRGNSFTLNVSRAQVGDVAITKGEVSFPEFMPKWRPTYYRFTADGDARAMLSILDQKPLALLSKVNLSPTQFSGKANAVVEIMRPNKRDVASEDYGYSGVASFENMSISDLIGDVNFVNARGKVDLKTRSMTVTADAQLADDAPIELTWTQRFYREDGPSEIEIAGVFDSTTGDWFGISPRQFVLGPVNFEARALGELGDFKTLDVNADFTSSVMKIDALGWRKPDDVPASGVLNMRFADDGVHVDALKIDAGEYANIGGALVFNGAGALQSASIAEFSLADAAELNIRAERDPAGVLVFTAVGPFLNAGAMIGQMLNGSDAQKDEPFPWGAGMALNARVDEIAMREGVTYRDGALDLRRDAERLQALNFTAFDENGTPLRAAMSLTGAEEGPQRSINAETRELGALMSGVFGLKSIVGGEGVLRLMLNSGEAAGFSGELEARRLQVVNAPLLARILSAGSLDGLANLVSGEGIEFEYAAGEFEYAQGVLTIDDLQATGSSVGITADGSVSFGSSGEASLNGAVAPLYMLNSVLGNTPIIGDILVGKKGEGIVAFTYSVGGSTSNPQVTVNPLSALTPGIFRRLMQPQQQAPSPPAQSQPDAAVPLEGQP